MTQAVLLGSTLNSVGSCQSRGYSDYILTECAARGLKPLPIRIFLP